MITSFLLFLLNICGKQLGERLKTMLLRHKKLVLKLYQEELNRCTMRLKQPCLPGGTFHRCLQDKNF